MTHMRTASGVLLCPVLVLALGIVASAFAATEIKPQQFEGQIKSVKVEKCGLQPGTCEGSIVLAKKGGGEVVLAIKPGTWLKRGGELVTIDELGVGNYVKVEAIQLPGEKLQRITVLSSEG